MKKRVQKNSVQSVTPYRGPISHLSRSPISFPSCCPISRPFRPPISPPSPCPISPPISLSNQCSSRCPVSPRSWSQSFPPLVVQSDLPRVVPSVPLPVVQSVPTPVVHTVSPFRSSISPSIALSTQIPSRCPIKFPSRCPISVSSRYPRRPPPVIQSISHALSLSNPSPCPLCD